MLVQGLHGSLAAHKWSTAVTSGVITCGAIATLLDEHVTLNTGAIYRLGCPKQPNNSNKRSCRPSETRMRKHITSINNLMPPMVVCDSSIYTEPRTLRSAPAAHS